ncbi:unnamed protein product [Periconia digitata]|uniref:Uncharacterized protein n=1 Tax=Periconia digitata TaxID=1303443 RepID=A0A9W4U7N5_9PLEO|nr:unnamed protein product [Periconia digitata]
MDMSVKNARPKFEHPLSPEGLEQKPNTQPEFEYNRAPPIGFFNPFVYKAGDCTWKGNNTWTGPQGWVDALAHALRAERVTIRDSPITPAMIREAVRRRKLSKPSEFNEPKTLCCTARLIANYTFSMVSANARMLSVPWDFHSVWLLYARSY